MSWNDIMRRMLPPVWDNDRKAYVPPHTTSPYGATDRPPRSSNPDKGVDFNYFAGKDLKFNKSNPAIRSPVSGIVENAGQGDYGTISIRDADGYLHQILHTHRRHVNVGDPVVAGQLIGTMGNTGVDARGVEKGDAHVHYQLFDPNGNRVNPMEYWDQQGPIDLKPAPPAYLDDYQRYLATPGAAMGDADINAPNAGVVDKSALRRFQSPPTKTAVPYLDQTNAARQHFANVPAAVPAEPSPEKPNGGPGPADPWTDANLPRSFDGRFGTGNWPPFAPADNQGSPISPTPQSYRRSENPDVPPSTPASFDIPGSYFGRLLTNTAHLVPDDRQPSAQAASLPLAPSDPTGADRQGSFNNPFGNAVPSQAPAPKLPSDFPELSSPDLPRGWSRMTPEELIQALPQHEPEPLSGEAAHEWFANWIKSFR